MNAKEAIERIKTRFDKWALDDEDMKAIQTLIPELEESAGEKIRKTIIYFIKQGEIKGSTRTYSGVTEHEMIAYLERQKEQPSVENPENIHNRGYVKGVEDAYNNVNEARIILKRLAKENPKPAEWSEGDERMYKAISIALTRPDAKAYLRSWHKTPEDADAWLKSLRPQPHWKPSEEQMEALHYVKQFDYGGHRSALESLYYEIKNYFGL